MELKKKQFAYFAYKPMPFFSYCANSMEMLVPRGQLNETRSESHVVFWNVRNVPESNAKFSEMDKEKEKISILFQVYAKRLFAQFSIIRFVCQCNGHVLLYIDIAFDQMLIRSCFSVSISFNYFNRYK